MTTVQGSGIRRPKAISTRRKSGPAHDDGRRVRGLTAGLTVSGTQGSGWRQHSNPPVPVREHPKRVALTATRAPVAGATGDGRRRRGRCRLAGGRLDRPRTRHGARPLAFDPHSSCRRVDPDRCAPAFRHLVQNAVCGGHILVRPSRAATALAQCCHRNTSDQNHQEQARGVAVTCWHAENSINQADACSRLRTTRRARTWIRLAS